MKRGHNGCYMIIFSSFCQDSSCSVLNKLVCSCTVWKTSKKAGRHKCMYYSFSITKLKDGFNVCNVTETERCFLGNGLDLRLKCQAWIKKMTPRVLMLELSEIIQPSILIHTFLNKWPCLAGLTTNSPVLSAFYSRKFIPPIF